MWRVLSDHGAVISRHFGRDMGERPHGTPFLPRKRLLRGPWYAFLRPDDERWSVHSGRLPAPEQRTVEPESRQSGVVERRERLPSHEHLVVHRLPESPGHAVWKVGV